MPTTVRRSVLVLSVAAVLAACSGQAPSSAEPDHLTLWSHGGTPGEQAVLTEQVAAFEAAEANVDVTVRVVAEGDYGDVVQEALAAGELPDVLDVDGPLVASYAYQGALAPLEPFLSSTVRGKMLPSLTTQGTWRGHLWAVGAFDSGLALYGNRRLLTGASIRIPTGPGDAWTIAEMNDALRRLAARDPDQRVLDLKLDYGTGEWLTYGFAPLLYSAGGALVSPTGLAAGTLDGPASTRALTALQSWAQYADPDTDGAAFTRGRVALSWVGHWAYPDYHKALGADLVLLPLPDLGEGTKSGQGSWAWGVGSGSAHKPAAARLVAWLTNDASSTTMTAANGAVPGTRPALLASALVGPSGPLHLYGDQLAHSCSAGATTPGCITVPRPLTPAYPTITAAFALAVEAVFKGADPHQALATAAATIDADFEANHGYTLTNQP